MLSEDQYKVNLTLDAIKYHADSLGVETSIDINDWVDVGVYVEGTEGKNELIYLEKHRITDQVTKLEIFVDQEPNKAGIDPLGKLIDKNTKNNIITLSEKQNSHEEYKY